MKPLHAAGLLIADGGLGGQLEIREHTVQVTINNGIAVTTVTQIFHNMEKRQVEALYTFPVPKNSSVSNFSMWINGKEMVGEVVEKERAREIYNSYKQVNRDPGLLEQVDYKKFEMRIFPIAADADQKVQITYYQELETDHDRVTFVYPLATVTSRNADAEVKGKFSFNIDIKSEVPIEKVESPSHDSDFVTTSHTRTYYQASMENSAGSLNRDIVVSYVLSRPQTGIDVISSRVSREDGYFFLTVTAAKDLAQRDDGMDYVFVLDVSGSMGDAGKMRTSRSSIDAFINTLGANDRFEVLTFNIQPYLLFNTLSPVTKENLEKATEFLGAQETKGGTVLNPALTTAYKYADPDRNLNVVILSDGMTDPGETNLLVDLIKQRPSNVRVFCIGVGNEVNRPLLEQLAEDAGGLADFISSADDFNRKAEAFRRKLQRPSMSNVSITFDKPVYDCVPEKLPDLYHGQQLHLFGRYKKAGDVTVTINADIRGKEYTKKVKIHLADEESSNPEIERMWAQKRISVLTKQINAGNRDKRIIDEIINLGEGYSIVSEYTSFLVLENDVEYKRWKIDRRNALRIDNERKKRDNLRGQLETIKNKGLSELGPQNSPANSASSKNMVNQTVSNSTPSPSVDNSPFDFNSGSGGSGPIGPLFLIIIGLFSRLKRNRHQKGEKK